MKSKTKAGVSPKMVRTIVKKHFPNEEVKEVKELTDGMFNTAYFVQGTGDLDQGCVLKVGPEEGTEILTYELEILRTEVTVYEMLKTLDIPVPQIYAFDYSHQEIPCDYFLMSYIPGDAWKNCIKKIPKEKKPQLMQELGKYNALIHSVEGNWFGYIKENQRFHFDTWAGAFEAMVNDILEDGRGRKCKLPYEKIQETVVGHRKILNEIKTPKLVDFDLWAGNVFLQEKTCDRITGVVDFERSFFGDPYADFTSAMEIFDDVEKEADFQKGYSQITNKPLVVSKNDRVRMDLYRLYMAVILFVETYRYDKMYAIMVQKYCQGNIKKLLDKLSC